MRVFPLLSNRLLLCISLLASFPVIATADALKERRSTERSVVFLWPGQSPNAARFDLNQAMVTDRPSFTDSSRTVGSGVTQIETGYTFIRTQGSSRHTYVHQYPEFSLRQGVLVDWFELRLRQALTTVDSSTQSFTGWNDMEVQGRFGLFVQKGWLPEVAVTPSLQLPTGSSRLGADHVLPGLGISYSWALPRALSLGGNTVYLRAEDPQAGESFSVWSQSLVGGLQIASATSVFFEGFGLFQGDGGASEAYFADTGVVVHLNVDTQLDFRIGGRVDSEFLDDTFAGVGVSVRFI